jgi:sec-independent protein translocase protein TatA
MEGFGFWKLLLLLVIVVLVFGTAKLPRIGEDLGKAVRSFKKAMHEGDETTSGGNDGPKGDKH